MKNLTFYLVFILVFHIFCSCASAQKYTTTKNEIEQSISSNEVLLRDSNSVIDISVKMFDYDNSYYSRVEIGWLYNNMFLSQRGKSICFIFDDNSELYLYPSDDKILNTKMYDKIYNKIKRSTKKFFYIYCKLDIKDIETLSNKTINKVRLGLNDGYVEINNVDKTHSIGLNNFCKSFLFYINNK